MTRDTAEFDINDFLDAERQFFETYVKKVVVGLRVDNGLTEREALILLGKQSIQLMVLPGAYVEGSIRRLDGPQDAVTVRSWIEDVLNKA